MSFYDSLRKNLTPELFTQITDQLGDDFDFDLVPRSRLNKVIKQRNDLRDQLAGASQPQGSKEDAHNEEDDDDGFSANTGKRGAAEVDIESLKQQWLQEQSNAVNEVRMQYAALEKLRAANAIDAELIWQAGLVNKDKLSVKEDGSVEGLDAVVDELSKSRPALFDKGSVKAPRGTGKDGGGSGDDFTGVASKADFLKLSTAQQIAFKKANPEVFKTFLN